jgi:hypothetical protein
MSDDARAALAAEPGFMRLMARGAYIPAALPAGSSDPTSFAVFAARNGYRAPIAWLAERVVAAAIGLELLVLVPEPPARWRLSAAGQTILRRRLSQASTPAQSGPARAQSQPETSMCGVAPHLNEMASALLWLRQRRDRDGRPLISEAQFMAGERLAADFYRGGLMPKTTIDWSAVARGGRQRVPSAVDAISAGTAAAQQRVRRAIDDVSSDYAALLLDVCCFSIGLADVERRYGWPHRSARIVLQFALTRLATHYGLIVPVRSAPDARISHWGDAGYKPTLERWQAG